MTVYCDGSIAHAPGIRNGGPGRIGMGAVLVCAAAGVEREYSWSESLGRATNIIAELEAIKGGLLKVRPALRRQVRVTVVTDSLWSIEAIEGKFPLVQHRHRISVIRLLLQEFGAFTFQHVKGHAGHRENERCDQLARCAARAGNSEVAGGPGAPDP